MVLLGNTGNCVIYPTINHNGKENNNNLKREKKEYPVQFYAHLQRLLPSQTLRWLNQ